MSETGRRIDISAINLRNLALSSQMLLVPEASGDTDPPLLPTPAVCVGLPPVTSVTVTPVPHHALLSCVRYKP